MKLLISLMGGVVSLKLPFTLIHRNSEPDLMGFPSPVREYQKNPEPIKDKVEETVLTTDDDIVDRKAPTETKKALDQMADVDLIEHSEGPEST